MMLRERAAELLRALADRMDGSDYYCEHWSIGWENGRQVAKWTVALPQAGVTWGMPLYSRKDEQEFESADHETESAWEEWKEWMSDRYE